MNPEQQLRVDFERQYASGDDVSDAISLARRDDGEYEQALARLCFKWFCKGRTAPEGFALVPLEPTPAMVKAAFKAVRMTGKYVQECISGWAPNAGKRHPHEPGIVSEIRAAIAEGAKMSRGSHD